LLRKPAFRILLAAFLLLLIAASGLTLYYYRYYSDIINRRLAGQVFQNTARLYAAPYHVYPGQKISPEGVVARLQRAGLEPLGSEHADNGTYTHQGNRINIAPAVGDALRLDFRDGTLTRIVRSRTGEVGEALLPAELVTSFSDSDRQKRRIVEFRELPQNLINALIAAEDNRFYSHWGIDPIRLVGAAVQRLRTSQWRGTSTLTQQLARNFFLTSHRTSGGGFARTPTRKIHEIFISLLLEQRLTKDQILELYANDVYLGARGSFMIKGFGEAAVAYFGKDLSSLTLPESALLVAIIPAPSGAASPVNHPDEAKRRRNVVLTSMQNLGFITAEEAAAAKESEIKLAPIKMDATDAPYLVDYIRETLLKDFSEDDLNNESLRVFTTIDPDLQRAAVEAVNAGLADVIATIEQRNKNRKDKDPLPVPQAAFIALETRTGRIVAMVGGSDYGISQLNRITQARRQPGSIFKPFVFAAGFEAAEQGLPLNTPNWQSPAEVEAAALATDANFDAQAPAAPQMPPISAITPITLLEDVATTFLYDGGRVYEPNNYGQKFSDPSWVTARYALEKSLNIPTVKVGELIGFDRVADLATRSGMNANIKGYPSVALGAFEVTPLEIAGAYTIFPNAGKLLAPHALLKVVESDGAVAKTYSYAEKQVISPQVAYLMTNLMEGVISQGTGAGVRSRGFRLPAAGKTGTSRDGWFAGYTKDYIAIAWVGYDDNRDLNMEGAKSALPIWTNFMLKAQQLYPPRNMDAMQFAAPEGMEYVTIDNLSHLPANSACTETYNEVFLPGTVPSDSCPLHGSISTVIEEGVRQTGRGIGKVFSAIGGFLGLGRSNPESGAAEEPSTSPR
jgi:penicillin-binding protein 1B